MAHWQVIVGNIGTVYDGANGFTARQDYDAYVGLSRAPYGRASGESVVLFRGGEIELEHAATEES